MSFLDKVKSVFIVSENEPVKPVEKLSDGLSATDLSSKVVSADSGDLSKFWTLLSEALEKNNEPGFDYLEFRKALLAIRKLGNLDEAAQYKTAYAAAEALDVDAKKLIETAKRYLTILKGEYEHFNQTAKEFQQKELSSIEEDGTRLKNLIQEKEATIARLQKEVGEHKEMLNAITNRANEVTQKVESNKTGFVTVYNQLVDQIQSDIRNMDQHLKN